MGMTFQEVHPQLTFGDLLNGYLNSFISLMGIRQNFGRKCWRSPEMAQELWLLGLDHTQG